MLKKVIPGVFKNTVVERVILSKVGIYASYWLFQGMLYMDWRETVFKLVLDAFFVYFLYCFGTPLTVSVLIAHTLNMVFNGHVVAMRRHMGLGETDPGKFIKYISDLRERLATKHFILGGAAYGSLSRNVFRPTSDLDIRIFPVNNLSCWAKAVAWICWERAKAFANSFPMDIYIFDIGTIDEKMKTDESPVIFTDANGILVHKYFRNVDFEVFRRNFIDTYIDKS